MSCWEGEAVSWAVITVSSQRRELCSRETRAASMSLSLCSRSASVLSGPCSGISEAWGRRVAQSSAFLVPLVAKGRVAGGSPFPVLLPQSHHQRRLPAVVLHLWWISSRCGGGLQRQGHRPSWASLGTGGGGG